jgi:hypothetical protein
VIGILSLLPFSWLPPMTDTVLTAVTVRPPSLPLVSSANRRLVRAGAQRRDPHGTQAQVGASERGSVSGAAQRAAGLCNM